MFKKINNQRRIVFTIFLILTCFLKLPDAAQSYKLKRGSFANSGGSAVSEANSLLESAFGTMGTGISAGSGFTLYGGMSISGKVQLFRDIPFKDTLALFGFSFGTQKKNYRIISIPAFLAKPDPDDVLVDDLGKYDKKKWRLFDCQDGNGPNTEYPDTKDFNPGRGLFIIIKDGGKTIDIENGHWIGNEIYSIPLQRGWNLIGNPYNMELPLNQLQLQSTNQDDSLGLWEYNGDWVAQKNKIVPWRGYAMAVEDSTAQLLVTRYPDKVALPKGCLTELANESRIFDWQIQILARIGELQDNQNYIGVSNRANSDRDKLDQFEPPSIGDYISVYFPHPEWSTFLKNLGADYRPQFHQGEIWDFNVRSNLSESATLTFAGVENVPPDYDIRLKDVANSVIIDLRQNTSYKFALSNANPGKQFQLIVGTAAYISKETALLSELPENYQLHQNYPNPFNPATTILFDLPKSEKVTIRILNVLGQEVVLLLNSQQVEAGRHPIIWDGRNQAGQKVGNGVYFFQMIAGDWQEIKKMVLLP